MFKKLRCRWSEMIASVLLPLALLGTSPIAAASAPRLLWHTEPQGG